MNRKTKISLISTTAILSALFAYLIIPSSAGAGYDRVNHSSGYHGSSFYYWGTWGRSSGVSVFQTGPSVKNGSVGGPRHTGRGLSGGK